MVWSGFYLNYLATLYRQAIDHQTILFALAGLKVFESMMQQQPLYDFFRESKTGKLVFKDEFKRFLILGNIKFT